MIRPFEDRDTGAVLAIWTPVIRHTTITFSSEEKTPDSLAAMVAERRAAGREFLVAEADGEVLGFATYAQFRGGNGYAHAMEHTGDGTLVVGRANADLAGELAAYSR